MVFIFCFGLLAACDASPPASETSNASSNSSIVKTSNTDVLTGLPRAEGLPADQRPIAIMVANSESSLPQHGISSADVIYEMVTEGGITRLMAVFSDYRTVPTVGPVRSIRDQFVQLAAPYNMILAHIGSSIYANNLLNVLEYQNIDGIYLGKTSFFFDDSLAAQTGARSKENSYYTNAELLWAGMVRMDVHTTGKLSPLFNFTQKDVLGDKKADNIELIFSGNASSSFVYNPETKLFMKNSLAAPHTDASGSQLAFTNILVLEAAISLKPDGLCTEFDFSSGSGTYFVNGTVQPITWKKGSPTEQLVLFGADGNQLAVQAGKSYVSYIDSGKEAGVEYSSESIPSES